MIYLLGIDLGTSSVRAGIYREDGSRPGLGAAPYPIDTPAPDRSEQDPELWWRATTTAIKAALNDACIKGSQLAGIAFDGQMHGGALLDWDGEPVSPAIIWPDSRSAGVLDEITDILGDALITKAIMNRPFPGTFAATLYWMRKHDPSTWKTYPPYPAAQGLHQVPHVQAVQHRPVRRIGDAALRPEYTRLVA